MSYLSTKPTFTRTTGCTLETWDVMFVLSREFALSMPLGLAGLAQLGSLDAVSRINAGGMTNTGMGNPIPLFIERPSSSQQ